MNNLFSIGELAKYQNISKQTLIYYDKIDLFKPYYVDEHTGYRYYHANQLEKLDTILIMKTIGFSLQDIHDYLHTTHLQDNINRLYQQLDVINKKIKELSLIKNRVEERCIQVQKAYQYENIEPQIIMSPETFILTNKVAHPYEMSDISIATKLCYSQAFQEGIPIFFQCGVSVPLEKLQHKEYTQADLAFVTTDHCDNVPNILKLSAGLTITYYHFGTYASIGKSYEKIFAYCRKHHYEIISPSYEFCVNDYITTQNENEFITKIIFYIQ